MNAIATGSSVYPGILGFMPKVMVSMPDDLLAKVDAEADRAGTSRSAVLRGFAEAAIQQRRTDRARAMKEIIDEFAAPRGGENVAELVKALRPKP